MTDLEIVGLRIGDGEVGLCRAPGRHGAFNSDLRAVLKWNPDIVVTLLEDNELAQIGAEELPAMLAREGIDWTHIPIVDFGVPDPAGEGEWAKVAPDLLSRLENGHKILIHCMGGCGRTGMIALRLMLVSGENVDTALARLRAARPCTIETDAQMEWAVRGLRTG